MIRRLALDQLPPKKSTLGNCVSPPDQRMRMQGANMLDVVFVLSRLPSNCTDDPPGVLALVCNPSASTTPFWRFIMKTYYVIRTGRRHWGTYAYGAAGRGVDRRIVLEFRTCTRPFAFRYPVPMVSLVCTSGTAHRSAWY